MFSFKQLMLFDDSKVFLFIAWNYTCYYIICKTHFAMHERYTCSSVFTRVGIYISPDNNVGFSTLFNFV